MSDSRFEALVQRLVAAGAVYLRDGGVHVASAVWSALDADSQRALVARRDDIRELLQATDSGADSTPAHGLSSRRSQGGIGNDQGVIGGASRERVAVVSPVVEDSAVESASRDGQSEGSSTVSERGVEGVGGSVTARADSEGAGDVATQDRPLAGNVAASRGESNENSGMNFVSSDSTARPGHTQGNRKSKHSSAASYTSRYVRSGVALVDIESFDGWKRRSDETLYKVERRRRRRDFERQILGVYPDFPMPPRRRRR